MITQKRLKELVEYDAETGVFTRLTSPARRVKVGDVFGNKHRASGYMQGMIEGKRYTMHRLVWLYVHGVFPEEEVDHINGVRADNRLANLRSVSHKENSRNAQKPTNNTSGVVGVYWDKDCQKWRARIKVDYVTKNLGVFACLLDAVDARKSAERAYGFHPNHGRSVEGA